MKSGGLRLLLAVTLASSMALVSLGCGQGTTSGSATATATATATAAATATATPSGLFPHLRWIAYSPTNADPNTGIEPMVASITQDLAVLRKAGFSGLVTYGASGVMGRELPRLAAEAGFGGLIIGVWDPGNQNEMAAAEASSSDAIVLGYCVGNEGLHERYEMSALTSAIKELKAATGKPVTTSEEIDDYTDQALLSLGDWVFPNAHPYFHGQTDPEAAVRWTEAAYADLGRRAPGRLVLFKEVGLPTAGDTSGQLSEEHQEQYYEELAATQIDFVYFEAFDQPWKTSPAVEPHWGLFRADRSPKLLASVLMSSSPVGSPTTGQAPFYVYQDMTSQANHFHPSGYMGDIGDIEINEAYALGPGAGDTAIQVTYRAQGRGPNSCNYGPPCNWAGVYWQEPPNNWGTDAFWKDRGYDLSGYSRVTFWARAAQNVSVTFEVGGIAAPYGDSLAYPRSTEALLTPEWAQFTIDLAGADLSHIIGGFAWVLSREALTADELSDGGVVFYLDDIRYEP